MLNLIGWLVPALNAWNAATNPSYSPLSLHDPWNAFQYNIAMNMAALVHRVRRRVSVLICQALEVNWTGFSGAQAPLITWGAGPGS